MRKFEKYERELASLDTSLEMLSHRNGLELVKNMYGEPSRTLQRAGNPFYSIDIRPTEFWRDQKYHRGIPYDLCVGALYEDPHDNANVYLLRRRLIQRKTVDELGEGLPLYVERAMSLILSWTPEIIIQEGKKHKTAEEYLRQKGIG